MRRALLCVLMTGLLLLPACGGGDGGKKETESLQEEYQLLSSCNMKVQLRCDRNGELSDYLLQCRWQADGGGEVEILEPKELAGISARMEEEKLTLVYEDLSLAAQVPDGTGLSPAGVLPLLMDAVRSGCVVEQGTELLGEEKCFRLRFDLSEKGQEFGCAVWFGAGHVPRRAEVISGNAVIFTADFLEFSAQTEPGGEM